MISRPCYCESFPQLIPTQLDSLGSNSKTFIERIAPVRLDRADPLFVSLGECLCSGFGLLLLDTSEEVDKLLSLRLILDTQLFQHRLCQLQSLPIHLETFRHSQGVIVDGRGLITLSFAIVISGFIRRRLSTFSLDLLVRSFRILFRDPVRLGLCCFPGRSLDGLTLNAGWRFG